MKNNILLAFFLLTLKLSMAQECKETSRYLKIDSITKFTEHSGVYGGGSLVTYTVFFTIKSKHLKYFDSAWAYNNSAMVVLSVPKNSAVSSITFRKKNHFRLLIGIPYYAGQSSETGNLKLIKKPIDCPQELILRFKAKKKFHYIVCSNFTKIPDVNLP